MKPAAHTKRLREGKYANYLQVGHNALEFYLDFGRYDPASESAQMHTRIVTSPAGAKIMSEMLSSSIAAFEREHGPVATDSRDEDIMEMVRQSLAETERNS
jgi:hypothetical protein